MDINIFSSSIQRRPILTPIDTEKAIGAAISRMSKRTSEQDPASAMRKVSRPLTVKAKEAREE